MINVLERITHFRNLKGWTEYQLAEKSGLNTIHNSSMVSQKHDSLHSFVRKNSYGFWNYSFPIFR